jgi:hypothetical protein
MALRNILDFTYNSCRIFKQLEDKHHETDYFIKSIGSRNQNAA